MKKKEFNQTVTFYVFAADHVLKTGASRLYLRVIISRKKKELPLNVSWPKERFDIATGRALPRFDKDPDVAKINLIINEAKGKANKIQLRFFANDRLLTVEIFEKEFINYMSSENFLLYWKTKQLSQCEDGIISAETKKHETTNYNRLVSFLESENLPFCDIDINLVKKYDTWMRKTKGLKHNTVCTAHKTFKTYINHAIGDKIKVENPYEKFRFSFRDGERDVLEDDELQALEDLYLSFRLDEVTQEVLRKFLFSCYTGLRIGDSKTITSESIKDGKLRLATKKGLKYGKVVSMLLPEFAKRLINGRTGLLFDEISDSTCNRQLKFIASEARVKKHLSFHVSRDTFGTRFISLGGDVYTLMLLMGHSDIKTTMIYIKLSEKVKDKQMLNLNRPATNRLRIAHKNI